MNPDQTAALAMAYIKAFSPVVLALAVLSGSVYAAVMSAIQKKQIEDQNARLNRHSAAISTLQLNTPSPIAQIPIQGATQTNVTVTPPSTGGEPMTTTTTFSDRQQIKDNALAPAPYALTAAPDPEVVAASSSPISSTYPPT